MMVSIIRAVSIVALVAALSGCLFPPPGGGGGWGGPGGGGGPHGGFSGPRG
ncbi:hypothetical protein [Erwinia aphidicola]|uniref:hypothetical protein n=1 Tax=Erwinia aphidicola TaxID=68334 RepID=UPI00301A837A